MTPEETVKPKRTRKVKEQPPQVKHLCHVHDKCGDYVYSNERKVYRYHICRNLETTIHIDGKYYCLLHLPTKDKDADKFQQIIDECFDEVAEGIAKIEAELPEDDWEEAKAKLDYDFRYVWFPKDISFPNKTFSGWADFSWATFNAEADFSSAKFEGYAIFSLAEFKDYSSFSSATFSGSADFKWATFSGEADFSWATFSGSADFSSAIFRDLADFSSAIFNDDAEFNSATFDDGAYFASATFGGIASFRSAIFNKYSDFSLATFSEKSQLFFIRNKFHGVVIFNYANINGFVAFEGKNDNRVFVGKDSLLDLQNARIDDAKKISFHTVRLEPSWFVNQKDVAEFVFTDCKWRYADGKRLKVKTEIKKLVKRNVSDSPHEILTKACWQLADNHEESKSLGKASMFRKFANESKRLATPWYLQPFTLHWWYYAVSFYGESWRRALVVLVCILSAFAFLFTTRLTSFDYGKERPRITRGYTDVLADNLEILKTNICGTVNDSEQFRKMNRCEAVSHSLAVASFQRPEPKAEGFFTKFLITLEAILATLQAALLALAIRRKFMR
jgi:uncharacterized protein YjbI with pentapeptide repeats